MGFISGEVIEYFDFYLGVLVTVPASVMGVCGNLICGTVFLRQGAKDCVSLCLLALTLSDLCSVLSGGIVTLFNLVMRLGLYSMIQETAFIFIMSYTCGMFYDISQAVLAFVTLERCLCVAMPLKFGELFNFRRALLVVSGLYMFTVVLHIPHYTSSGVRWGLDPTTNTTRLVLWMAEYRPTVDAFLNMFLHIILSTLYEVIVLVSTYVMVRGLKRSAKFRQRNDTVSDGNPNARKQEGNNTKNITTDTEANEGKRVDKSQGQGMSQKNLRVVKMVTALAVISLVCNSLRLTAVYCQRLVPGLAFMGQYQFEFIFMNRFVFLFQTINASANIAVYYTMNASFRNTLKTMCCGSNKKNMMVK